MNTRTRDEVAAFVLGRHSGRTYITIDEAIALVSAALAAQGRSGHIGWHIADHSDEGAESAMPPVYRSRNVA